MAVFKAWHLPVDITQGLWLNAERDEFGETHYSMTIIGQSVSINEAQYYEMQKQAADRFSDGQWSGRRHVLNLLKKNLARFDYSNNGCDPLSFDDFAKLCDEQ